MKVWEWIVANIDTLKDALSIFFTFIATLVAVLTYRRARFTLLQSLRTEVVKRQTDLLVELLDFLYDDGVSFSIKIDYMRLVECNIYAKMREYGFDLNNAYVEFLEKNFVGMLVFHDNQNLTYVEVPEVFGATKEKTEYRKEEIIRATQKYENTKSGIVNIDNIAFTKQYFAFSQQMKRFIDNPFMPSEIQKQLKQMMSDIQYNLSTVLRKSMENFVLQLCEISISDAKDNPIEVNPQAIYNDFNNNRKRHKEQISKIQEKAREYLMIDKKWG